MLPKDNITTIKANEIIAEKSEAGHDLSANITHHHTFKYATEVLDHLLFQRKQRNWSVLFKAISKHSGWIYSHSVNVALISTMIAMDIGYKNDDLVNLGLGALLHDFGMVFVPLHIIQKSTYLDEQERLCVNQHCELGVRAAKKFDLPNICEDIMIQHHERLDGSGYPYGLTGDKITDNSKIVMIADVIDAITSYRPYREARDLSEAINELRSEETKYSKDIIAIATKILM